MTEWTPEKRLRVVASVQADAQENLELQIREAYKHGLSLRKIAAAVGLNHETVRTIIRREEP